MKLTIIISAILACALAAPAAEPAVEKNEQTVKTIELKTVETMRERLIKEGTLDGFRAHVNTQKVLRTFSLQHDEQALQAEEFMDASFAWEIGIGQPSQPFRALFTLLSPYLWVPDSSCLSSGPSSCPQSMSYCKLYCGYPACSRIPACACHHNGEEKAVNEIAHEPSGCEGKRAFDQTRSSSYGAINNGNDRFEITLHQYDTVEGFIGYDEVELFGIYAKQYVQLADHIGGFWHYIDADGLMGFGFPQTESKSGLLIRPYLINAFNSHRLYADTFSIYMNKYGGNAISIGGENHAWYSGQLQFHNVLQNSNYWEVEISKFWLGSNNFVNHPGRAVLSASHNYIGVPYSVLQAISKAVGITGYDNNMELFTVLCGYPLQDVALFIDNNIYSISHDDYVIQSGGRCYLGFKALTGHVSAPYLLGTPFLKAYYSVYEFNSRSGRPRVGFAKSTP